MLKHRRKGKNLLPFNYLVEKDGNNFALKTLIKLEKGPFCLYCCFLKYIKYIDYYFKSIIIHTKPWKIQWSNTVVWKSSSCLPESLSDVRGICQLRPLQAFCQGLHNWAFSYEALLSYSTHNSIMKWRACGIWTRLISCLEYCGIFF